ncbi:hypothetical protein Q9S36_18360 [Microbacterium sp. ARD31]|uniref:hypothetical protein n=1 Tax=Microbacterium sp. ARD31 TaxID=2962576 RepID=UPI00288209DF|nr:hypothetical protein [Microbacterium sp. ARD31]MDT0182142.1 hypothetical protein [Microbacterium sp. ARD31]
MKRFTKMLAASAGLALVAGLAAVPAFAEGSRGPGDFWNARTGFSSGSWRDYQNDSNNTNVKLSSCSLTNGDTLTSVQVGLWDEHGALPDAQVGAYKNLGKCGTASWTHTSSSYILRNSTFHWALGNINGSNRGYLVGTAYVTF